MEIRALVVPLGLDIGVCEQTSAVMSCGAMDRVFRSAGGEPIIVLLPRMAMADGYAPSLPA
jgi:hypothetical protein